MGLLALLGRWLLVALLVHTPEGRPIHHAHVLLEGVYDTGFVHPDVAETDSRGKFMAQVEPGVHAYQIALPSGLILTGTIDVAEGDRWQTFTVRSPQ